MSLLKRAIAWLQRAKSALATRNTQVSLALAAILILGSSIYFFTTSDKRGKNARLTADAWYYHAYLPSLVFDRDLDFRNEFKITKNWYRLGKTPTGRQANVFGIGPAIYELPFFLAGHGLARISGAEANGFSKWELRFPLYASLLFSLGAVFFAARLLSRRLTNSHGGYFIALLIACGGPVVYYATRQPGYAHPFASFWIAWLVDYWDSSFTKETKARSRNYWIGFGLLVGAASLARPQLTLWCFLGLFLIVDDIRRIRRARAKSETSTKAGREMLRVAGWAFLSGLGALLIFSPQLLAWKSLYGSFIASPQGDGFMRWGESAWLETLFSSRNGLLPWAPIYGIALVGTIVGLYKHTRIASALLVGLLIQAYVNGAAWDWWAGGSFGGRRFDSCYIVFVFGLGVLLQHLWQIKSYRQIPIGRVTCTLLAIVSLLLSSANLHFAGRQSAHTVRIYGGQSASVFLSRSPWPLGPVAARFSLLSNLPARAHFAWKYRLSLKAYDQIVGVHHLGELFPGLNSFRGKKRHKINLDPRHPRIYGLRRKGKGWQAPSGEARVLFALNRKGPIALHLKTTGPPPALYLNEKLAVLESTPIQGEYRVEVANYFRGVNQLDIKSSPDTLIDSIELRSQVNAAGHTVP